MRDLRAWAIHSQEPITGRVEYRVRTIVGGGGEKGRAETWFSAIEETGGYK